MNALEALIGDVIRRDGPISVARYMDLALYHPEHGYYAGGRQRSGRSGHFLTSPEVDPTFAHLWCAAFARVWDGCGRPARFDVVEVGPGEGGFAAGLLSSASGEFGVALHLRLIERIAALRARQMERLPTDARVEWSTQLESCPPVAAGVVFVNEVLDNLPVHLVEGSREIYVDLSSDGLCEVRGDYSEEVAAVLRTAGVNVPEGARAEIPVAADRFVRACAGLVERGAVVFVDYGDTWDGLLDRRAGTLVCYSSRGADDAYLESPGAKDVTAHANWSVVAAALEAAGCRVHGPVPQRDVLLELGLDGLHEQLRAEVTEANAAGDGRRAVRAMSRRGALGVLTDAGGLGGLGVIAGSKSVPSPGFDQTS